VSGFPKLKSKQSSRSQINIKGVEEGILILPNDQYRLVLEASSVNFELKSDDEQDAIIEAYRSFLNSLPCPVQIVARIRELDMQRYVEDFSRMAVTEEQQIYRQQIGNYIDFVQGLVATNKILSRRFYVVIPFTDKDGRGFESVHERLLLNADIVAKGLSRLGIRTRRLSSLGVLDLFYSFYGPENAKRQPLTDQTMRLLRETYL
jgi:hypothetical protein